MSWRDALHALVHDHPGGCEALAVRMKLAYSTLRSMANPNCETHDWPMHRVVQAMGLTGDTRPLDALASQFGGVFVKTATLNGVGDDDLYQIATRLGVDFGDVVRSMQQAVDAKGEAGRAVSAREFAEFEQHVYELQAAAAELKERLSARVVRQPPAQQSGKGRAHR